LWASNLLPAFGFVQPDDSGDAVFKQRDVVAALKRAAEAVSRFKRPLACGFERRLNDVTCSGCHQTRGMGGFHFPRRRLDGGKPSNSTVVPASPHFFGDQIRRRNILIATGDGGAADFSPRGFPAARNCAAARNSPARV